MGGNLAFESRSPAAGNFGRAVGTAAILGEAIIFDQIAVALDQSFVALRAARVFPLANSSWEIAGVDISQPGFATDFDGTQEVIRARVARIGHLVIAVECGNMPGN